MTLELPQAIQVPRFARQRYLSPEARHILLAGFIEGRRYEEISATILRATREKISVRTVNRRHLEWRAAARRAEIEQVFAPGEALAAIRWNSEEIANLVAQMDRKPGAYERRRRQLYWALRLFMKGPGPERLHELCELLLLFLFEREFESSSSSTPADPGGI